MIKLEVSTLQPAIARLTLQSGNSDKSIVIQWEKARSEGADGKWVDDPTKVKQIVRASFFKGEVELAGEVPESEAVDRLAAWRVVCDVDLTEIVMSTYQAGQKSRSLPTAKLVRVIEVWTDTTKPVWRAKESLGGPSGKVVDMANDRIAKP